MWKKMYYLFFLMAANKKKSSIQMQTGYYHLRWKHIQD